MDFCCCWKSIFYYSWEIFTYLPLPSFFVWKYLFCFLEICIYLPLPKHKTCCCSCRSPFIFNFNILLCLWGHFQKKGAPFKKRGSLGMFNPDVHQISSWYTCYGGKPGGLIENGLKMCFYFVSGSGVRIFLSFLLIDSHFSLGYVGFDAVDTVVIHRIAALSKEDWITKTENWKLKSFEGSSYVKKNWACLFFTKYYM